MRVASVYLIFVNHCFRVGSNSAALEQQLKHATIPGKQHWPYVTMTLQRTNNNNNNVASWCCRLFRTLVVASASLLSSSDGGGGCYAQEQGDAEGIRNHVVHAWYTSTDEATGITTLMEQANVDTINTAAQVYEFSNFPNIRTPPSGMRVALDVTLSEIRIEITTPPSSIQPYTDRLYLYFDSPFLAAVLVTPASGLTAEQAAVVSIESFPPDTEYELEFIDPQLGTELVFNPSIITGGLVLEFANLTTATATNDALPSVLEFTYDLDIAPTASPTVQPTLPPTPSPTIIPTSVPTVTAVPVAMNSTPSGTSAAAVTTTTTTTTLFGWWMTTITVSLCWAVMP